LSGVYFGKNRINGGLFCEIASHLGISVLDMFRNPKYESEKTKEYWINEMRKNPISSPKQDSLDKDLSLYIALRAMEKLNQGREPGCLFA
jgi:hypothetical protein